MISVKEFLLFSLKQLSRKGKNLSLLLRFLNLIYKVKKNKGFIIKNKGKFPSHI